MIPMTLPEIAAVVGGEVHDDTGVTVTGPAFHDSRAVEPGGLFVAVRGERVESEIEHQREGGGVVRVCPVGDQSHLIARERTDD